MPDSIPPEPKHSDIGLPYFFFSYARVDWDGYLERFYNDLRDRVSKLTSVRASDVAFRDTAGIKSGEDWNSSISTALQASRVFVCVYTTSFFSKVDHQFCGKEFHGFALRSPDLGYETTDLDGVAQVRIRNAKNIVPILWFGERDLLPLKLPPHAVTTITYTLNEKVADVDRRVAETYRTKGLELISRRRQGTAYLEVVGALARLIGHYGATPLPPSQERPNFATLLNAFWDTKLLPEDRAGAAPPSSQSEPLALGPRSVLVLQVVSDQLIPWTPYRDGPNLAEMVIDAIGQRKIGIAVAVLNPRSPLFVSEASGLLANATAANNMPILFVDPRCLLDEPTLSTLVHIVGGAQWRGGVLIPVQAQDQQQVAAVERLHSRCRATVDTDSKVVIRTAADSSGEFKTKLLMMLDEIAALVIKHGQVQRPSPENSGPDRKPSIVNVPTN